MEIEKFLEILRELQVQRYERAMSRSVSPPPYEPNDTLVEEMIKTAPQRLREKLERHEDCQERKLQELKEEKENARLYS